MSSSVRDLTREALALSPDERLALASELLESVEGGDAEAWRRQWADELARRSDRADAREARGEPRGVSWSDVVARLRRADTSR